MTLKTELYTLHAMDLLDLLGASMGDGGTLTIVSDGEEIEVDLDDACLVVHVESIVGQVDSDVIPFSRN